MTSRVYVGRLNYDVRERDLERFFKGFGRIREISIKNGFGFVEFDDPRDADDAVYELNGKDLMGDRVSVELARGIRRGADYYRSRSTAPSPPRRRYGPPTRTEYQLTVENLSSRVSWQRGGPLAREPPPPCPLRVALLLPPSGMPSRRRFVPQAHGWFAMVSSLA
ncbi:hypothetical protein HPB47_004693 [Ixodes persulcatus]|uniref:Uncharacterized protein n=1 Tax=Ixodes persulcatus TaxID=34615 RepID=A0AC60PFT5_IXOPE|nr:hypothetical protein HPB47_004693 [Ixodes persulcatus]